MYFKGCSRTKVLDPFTEKEEAGNNVFCNKLNNSPEESPKSCQVCLSWLLYHIHYIISKYNNLKYLILQSFLKEKSGKLIFTISLFNESKHKTFS